MANSQAEHHDGRGSSSNEDPSVTEGGAELHLVRHDVRNLGWLDASMILINTMVGTGIFTLPAYIFKNVGSVGWYLLLWPLGALYALCGYLCWLELGLGIPRSGGEKNYLERVYRKPKAMMSTIFMVLTTLLYTSSANAVSFGRYFLFMCGYNQDGWLTRGVGVMVITFVILVHSFTPNIGRVMMKWLGIAKVLVLLSMIIIGFSALAGWLKPSGDPRNNFRNAFSIPDPGESCYQGRDDPSCVPQVTFEPNASGFSYALMNIIFTFSGWNTGNYVLGEIKNPNRNMKIAGILSISTVALVYMLANLAIFAVIPASEIGDSDLLISGVMFMRATGSRVAARVAGAFVALSNLGNIFSFSFGMARLNLEYGRTGMLPFSKFFARTTKHGSPAAGFLLHWIFTTILVIGPPPGSAYSFLVNLPTYAIVLMTTAVALGLLYMRIRPKQTGWSSPFKCPLPVVVLFIAFCLFLVMAPWIPRIDSDGQDRELPWYLSPTCGFAVLIGGVVYWFAWMHILPWLKGERIVEEIVMTDEEQPYITFKRVKGRRQYGSMEKTQTQRSFPSNISN